MDRSPGAIRTEPLPQGRRWAWLWAPGAGALLLAVMTGSCALTDEGPAGAWDAARWGPVVPHTTFPTQCDLCHVTGSWTELKPTFSFDHALEANYPLVGAHGRAKCLRCHNDRGPVQQFAQHGCRGCHVDPHEGKLGALCASCHSEQDWTPQGLVVRHLELGFALYGAHAAISCDQCHPAARSQDFRGAPTRCIDCHRADQQRATSPDHRSGNFESCQECHDNFGWSGAKFPHDTFPLTGGHGGVTCSACHRNNVFQGTPRNSVACHQADYAATTNPNHATGGFSTECQQCHTISGWRPATFAHTTFPLLGMHATTACASCHPGGRYAGTPRDCAACHQQDYAAATNPAHAPLGFPTQCQQCHNESGWRPSSWVHSTWPLTGAHTSTACSACHPNGRYAGTPRDCFTCHQARYNATTNPNHAAMGFGTQCEACHTTTSFRGATFNHPFPITSGAHAGVACGQCHTTPGNYKVFSCTGCHTAPIMNPKHSQVPGYSYSSPACYQCHPQGKH